MKVFSRKGEEGVSIIKGVGGIPFAPEEVSHSLITLDQSFLMGWRRDQEVRQG